MERFAATAERIASHPAKLEKIALLAEYLATLDDADLTAAARFFSGTAFAARDRRTLSIGGRTIVAVARRVWGFERSRRSAARTAKPAIWAPRSGRWCERRAMRRSFTIA